MPELVLGIDIGGTNSRYGLVSREGEVLHESNLPTSSVASADEFFQLLQLELESSPLKNQIMAVGVGAPSANYHTGCIEYAPNLSWGDVIPFRAIYQKYYDQPFCLTNDANGAAMGEKLFGGAKEMNDFVMVTLGTGLGGGLFVEGNLLHGYGGFAGEMGHVIVNPNGRQCACGRRGCLETYLSATGIKRTAFKMLGANTEKSLLRTIQYEKLTSKIIAEAALEDDFIAKKAFDYTGKILGMNLANLALQLSPEAFFLFGGLVEAGDLLVEPTRRYMREYMLPQYANSVQILVSELQNRNAAILGSAALAWEAYDSN